MKPRAPVDYWKRLVRIVLGMTLAAIIVPLLLAGVALFVAFAGW